MENGQIILTALQIQDLSAELEQAKEELIKARAQMENYRETERFTSDYGDISSSTVDDSYYVNISKLVTKIDEIKNILSRYILATPTGHTVQVGSIVELADSGKKIMVVQKRVTSVSTMKEVSVDSPIFGAIYMHKVGDICEYSVNGKACKCVIGAIDNEYSNKLAEELVNPTDTLDAKTKVL